MEQQLLSYLDRIIQNNKVVDSRGVMQVNRMIAVELEDIYISLKFESRSPGYPLIKRFVSDYEWVPLEHTHLVAPTHYQGIVEGSVLELKASLFEEASLQPKFHSDWQKSFYDFGWPYSQREVFTLSELWSRNKLWVILGDPGAGKSTLLKYLALDHARQCLSSRSLIPLTVTLRDLAEAWKGNLNTNDSILDYYCGPFLEEMGFNNNDRSSLRSVFEGALVKGEVLLLLDGLDEQRDAVIKRQTNTAIDTLLARYPLTRCVVTSRIIGYDAAPLEGGFETAVLKPFDPIQIAQFFNKWFYAIERSEDIIDDESTKKRAEKKATELIRQIEGNQAVGGLAANPLLCTIIGLIYRQGGSTLPTLRAELYKLCIDTFIFNWEMNKIRRGIDHLSLDKDETQAALEAIALHLHESGTSNAASRKALIDVVTSFLREELGYSSSEANPRAEKLLDLARDVAGLLIERGHLTYGFFHLTFQEYLSARAITRKRRLIDRYLAAYLFSPRWREVIHLAAAHQGMKDEESGSGFVTAILRHPHQREKEMQYAFRIAFQCATEARVELETSDELVRKWLELYLNRPELHDLLPPMEPKLRYRDSTLNILHIGLASTDSKFRARAAEAFGILKRTDAWPVLIRALQDEDADVRSNAARSLGEIKATGAVNPLLEVLHDKEENVRTEAAVALGELQAAEAVGQLMDSLLSEQDITSFSVSAARALGKLQSPDAVAPILSCIREGEETKRWWATRVLSQYKSEEVINELTSMIREGGPDTQRAAVRALMDINSPDVLQPLLAALEYGEVQSLAIYALKKIRHEEDEGTLLVSLSDANPVKRLWAAVALRKCRPKKVLVPLLRALRDEDERVRAEVAETLGDLQAKDAIEPLIEALQTAVPLVKARAAKALGTLKATDAASELIKALQDDDPNVKSEAAEALGEIKTPMAVGPLIDALSDKEKNVRSRAIAALSQIKAPAAVGPIILALTDENEDVRWEAAAALGEFKTVEGIPALLQALRDKNFDVRWQAGETLGEILRGSDDIGQLVPLLQDKDEDVRSIAATILGDLKAVEAVPALIGALKDEVGDVRAEAATALGELKATEAVPWLVKVMLNMEEVTSVRRAAAEAIEKIDMGGTL